MAYRTKRPRVLRSAGFLAALSLLCCACSIGQPSRNGGAVTGPVSGAPQMIDGLTLVRRISQSMNAQGSAHVVARRSSRGAGDGPVRATGVVSFESSGIRTVLVKDVFGTKITTVATPGVVQVRQTPTRTPGKPWSRIAVQPGTDPLAMAAAVQFEEYRLSLDLNVIVDRAPDVVFTISEESGIPGTRQYTAQLSTEQWLTLFTPAARAQRRAWARGASVTGETILIYLDQAGLPVQEVFTMVPNSARAAIDVTFSRWGEPVTISQPGLSSSGTSI